MTAKINSKLAGQLFCSTGALSVGRKSFGEIVRRYGGSYSTSLKCYTRNNILRRTHFLVAGEGGGNKRDKAKENGTTIISEEQFWEMVK